MSDTSPKNQKALQYGGGARPPRQPKPGELLFEFHVKRTHTFWRVELRDHGAHGVEVQFFDPGRFAPRAHLPHTCAGDRLAEDCFRKPTIRSTLSCGWVWS
jgi:hypothetical protein